MANGRFLICFHSDEMEHYQNNKTDFCGQTRLIAKPFISGTYFVSKQSSKILLSIEERSCNKQENFC